MGNFWDLFRDKTLLPMGGRADTITVSGFSSGSMMSANLHVIHSDLFKGAGMMMGTAYWTGEVFTNLEEYDAKSTAEQVQESIQNAQEYESEGKVASLDNLDGAPVYILSGLNDEGVPHKYQEAQRDFYQNFGANIQFE